MAGRCSFCFVNARNTALAIAAIAHGQHDGGVLRQPARSTGRGSAARRGAAWRCICPQRLARGGTHQLPLKPHVSSFPLPQAAEMNVQAMANRLARLKAQERKAMKKVQSTRQKADQIVAHKQALRPPPPPRAARSHRQGIYIYAALTRLIQGAALT